MNKIDHAEKLLQLTEEGTSPFHVTASVERQFQEAGFKKVQLGKNWKLEKGGRYYLVHHGTSLVAFAIGKCYRTGDAFRMAAAHTDFPGLRIKPAPEVKKAGYRQLNVEVYGGAILNTWLDRPLSASGRVALRSDDVFHPQMRLVDFKKPFLTIPNLAIHMNREANSGYKYNVQKDMLPLYGLESAKGSFFKTVAEAAGVKEEDILGHDLFLYNRMPGTVWGSEEEFVSAPRLDDLQCAFSSMEGLIAGKNEKSICVHMVMDNEEVGSGTRQGAASTFLWDTLLRINLGLGRSYEDYLISLAKSFMISADNAHAIHPNYPEKADPVNRPHINAGIAVKYNANQKYCTDGISAAMFKELCKEAGVSCQVYVNRSDVAGGSTLGNISNTQVALNTVDIGLPQLAMHSPYETAGVKDTCDFVKLAGVFYA